MSTQQTTRWGLTPPLSVKPPTDSELKSNDALIEELKRQNNYESSEETEKRYKDLNATTPSLHKADVVRSGKQPFKLFRNTQLSSSRSQAKSMDYRQQLSTQQEAKSLPMEAIAWEYMGLVSRNDVVGRAVRC